MHTSPWGRVFVTAALASPIAVLLALPGSLPVRAEEKTKEARGKKGSPPEKAGSDKEAGHDLETWGALKEVKGTPFFTISYTKTDGRKASKVTSFVKPAEDAEYYQDKAGSAADLAEGASIWILGRVVEHEVADKSGGKGIDRQLQNVLGIAAGEGLRVNSKYKDPKDPKVEWLKAEVSKAGPSITATHEGEEYKVVMSKQAPILLREKTEAKPLKNGVQVGLSCDKTDERPETKSAADAKKDSFVAKRVVFLDRRLVQTLYPMLLQ